MVAKLPQVEKKKGEERKYEKLRRREKKR